MLQGWASFFKTKSWVVESNCAACVYTVFLFSSPVWVIFQWIALHLHESNLRWSEMCYYLSGFDSLPLSFPFIHANGQMHVAQKTEVPVKFSLTFSFFLGLESTEKMTDVKTEWKGRVPVSPELGTFRRWRRRPSTCDWNTRGEGPDSAMGTPLTGTFANQPISQMVKQGWSSLKLADVNLWNVLFYNCTLQRSLIDCSCRCHAEALTS